jgi:hypothetical protein
MSTWSTTSMSSISPVQIAPREAVGERASDPVALLVLVGPAGQRVGGRDAPHEPGEDLPALGVSHSPRVPPRARQERQDLVLPFDAELADRSPNCAVDLGHRVPLSRRPAATPGDAPR